jgi:glutathione S-transferase
MMTMVLRELADTGLLERYANLGAYVRRCTDRPTFKRALEAQLQPFRENAPAA